MGDFRFAKEVLDRVDGKVPNRVTVDAAPDATEILPVILAALKGHPEAKASVGRALKDYADRQAARGAVTGDTG
jgi:hypothetical protein